MEKAQNVLVLEFKGIKCEMCHKEGTIRATGGGRSEIQGINFDTVLLKCEWCGSEYLMPVFFLLRNKEEAEQRLALIQGLEGHTDD